MRKNSQPLPLETIIADLRAKMAAGEFDPPPDPDFGTEAARRSIAKLSHHLGAKYQPDRINLASYQVYHKDQKATLQKCLDILGNLPALIRDGKNIVWYGAVGTGKDHLCCSLLYAAAQLGFDVDWRNVQRIYESSRDFIRNNAPEKSLVKELIEPVVLGLSDPIPPSGAPSDWNRNLLYRVLDERGRALRATWVTLNVSTKAAAEDEIIDALSMQVWDRMREHAEILPCFWPSFRGRK